MDFTYYLGELLIWLFTDRSVQRRRRWTEDVKVDADGRFAATAPRAAARMAWQELCADLSKLAIEQGLATDDERPAKTIEQLQQLGVLDSDFAAVLQCLAANFEPGTESKLSVADADAIRVLAEQFSARLAVLPLNPKAS